MSLLFVAPDRDMQTSKDAVQNIDKNINIEIWPDVTHQERVQFAVTWQQPEHVLSHYSNLQAISSLGAGADHILDDATIHSNIPVCRVVCSSLVQQMQDYILNAILNYQRNTNQYILQKQQSVWQKHQNKERKDLPVGVMGLGTLGKPIARQLSSMGYTVFWWARTPMEISGIQTFAGNERLTAFVSESRILVCLLPLTSQTRDILSLDIFKKLRHPAYLINLARGEHLVEEDLIYALDKEWLFGACLDVFAEEPLPEKHPFWNRANIMITPHVSSITLPDEVAAQIVENYKRALSGMELRYKVDRAIGY